LLTTSWRKNNIKEWLTSKGISFDDDSLKIDLLFIVNKVREKFEKFKIDELAKKYGCTVLRLPPYNCELNLIGMVGAQIKHYVGMKNSTFRKTEVEKLTAESFETITSENWKIYVEHVKKVEEDVWHAYTLQDDTEELVVRLHHLSRHRLQPRRSQGHSRAHMEGVESLSDS
jgi:hypothetical protein